MEGICILIHKQFHGCSYGDTTGILRKIIKGMDKIINLEVNLKHIYLKINSKIFKKALIKG